MPVDIATRAILDPVRVAEGGDVDLALSASGRTLAAASRRSAGGREFPTDLRVFAVDGGSLREIAAASFVAPCARLWSSARAYG